MKTIEDQIRDRDFKALREEFTASSTSDFHRQLVLFYLLKALLERTDHD